MKIPEEHLQKLRSHGLFVSEPRASDSCYPDGVLVGKPLTTAGNCIPGYSTAYVISLEDNEEISFNAPRLWLYGHCGVWVVLGQDYSPVPGPGDFLDEWSSPEEAVEDILAFYFGDPKRMQAKAMARKKPVRSPESFVDEPKTKRESA